jgi:hypothetical protein
MTVVAPCRAAAKKHATARNRLVLERQKKNRKTATPPYQL